jgi:thioredoxin reductase (NADPH)
MPHNKMIETDILIIGAGPTGLFAVFEAGLLKLKCHLIDALPQIGGQLAELYPKKPIYDIPGYPEVLAGDLVNNLMEQIKQFQPGFTLAETAETIDKLEDGTFIVTTNKGTKHHAKAVAIAGGLGTFEPRKPDLEKIAFFEEKGVEYFVKDPELFRDKKIVIAGGGDSALDWSIFLADVASEVTLIHRRNEFRGALDSVEKLQEYKKLGLVNLITPAEVTKLHGDTHLKGISINRDGQEELLETDFFIPLFGLTPKLGAIAH